MNVFKELRNVTWPSGSQLRRDTAVVIIAIIIAAIFLGLVDFVATELFDWFLSL